MTIKREHNANPFGLQLTSFVVQVTIALPQNASDHTFVFFFVFAQRCIVKEILNISLPFLPIFSQVIPRYPLMISKA